MTVASDRPATGRRERKRQHLAAHLAATAFGLFEEHGYDAVTMEQIAAAADVAKATLYRYFPMKEALAAHHFKEDIVRGMGDLAAELATHTHFESRMHFLLRASAAWHESRRAYMPHYLRYLNSQAGAETPSENASSVSWAILATMFRQAQQSGEVQTSVPAEKLAWSLEFLLYGAISAWLREPGVDLAAEFAQVFDLMLHGVAVDADAGKITRRGGGKHG